MSLAGLDIDAKSMHKDGRMVTFVINVEPGHMNLTGKMARNMRNADDEVTILFDADAVRQHRTTERFATPRSEEDSPRIIEAQRFRVHPYRSYQLI